ncbi:unnamed protein product [Cuscuta europaea]|uniref:Uncharacterized protein n=1 Tax=Cuscuta europaea TaxID=41803 RepID=A0A9P0Z9P6_CUSEU|nr:unnamed protein product [Cuscuta europaea]
MFNPTLAITDVATTSKHQSQNKEDDVSEVEEIIMETATQVPEMELTTEKEDCHQALRKAVAAELCDMSLVPAKNMSVIQDDSKVKELHHYLEIDLDLLAKAYHSDS